MSLEQTWRWFGPHDPVSFKEIKQTGAEGIVTALHQIPVGDVWPVNEIMKRKAVIEAEGLRWSVVESVPVHEEIKKRNGKYRQYIENYRQTIRNLGECGIDTVCYNFMPVLDWSRTDLEVVYHDGSTTTKFETNAFAAFDLFILRRPGAEGQYIEAEIRRARAYYETLDDRDKDRLAATVLLGLPGSGEAYTVKQLREALHDYEGIGEDELRNNLISFIKEILSDAEESGVRMVIHPDDPPRPLLGLPRVVGSSDDIARILEAADSPSNGLTLCTGSLGAGFQNDLVAIAGRFARKINFIHLRNVSRTSDGDFVEEDHLDGDIDLYGVMKTLLVEQERRRQEGRTDVRMPMRPDHGHLMDADRKRRSVYPGYSLFGRMRGLAELRGLELGILRSLQEGRK